MILLNSMILTVFQFFNFLIRLLHSLYVSLYCTFNRATCTGW